MAMKKKSTKGPKSGLGKKLAGAKKPSNAGGKKGNGQKPLSGTGKNKLTE
jgi:hypothetical protein